MPVGLSRALRGVCELPSSAALPCVSLIAAAAPVAQAAVPNLTISATASAVTVTGTPQAGGVNIISSSNGLKEASILLIKLKPGSTAEEVLSYVKAHHGDPNAVSEFGAIVFDAEAPAGKGSEAQTTLEPGSYLLLVVGEKGPNGTKATFTVAASPVNPALPAPQARIRSIDCGFKGPSTIKVGELVGFENEGWVVHMDFVFPVKSKTAAAKAMALLKAGNEKGLGKYIAGEPVAFTGPVSTGGYQQEVITAKPGWYVQACFMDTQDGRQHTLLGMERVLHIVK